MTATFADLIAAVPTLTYEEQVAASGFDPLAERDEGRAEAEIQELALAAALAEADEDQADEDQADEDQADEDQADEDQADEDQADEDQADENVAEGVEEPTEEEPTEDEATPCDETRALVQEYIAATPENPQPHDSI